jgi:hypothetical protein
VENTENKTRIQLTGYCAIQYQVEPPKSDEGAKLCPCTPITLQVGKNGRSLRLGCLFKVYQVKRLQNLDTCGWRGVLEPSRSQISEAGFRCHSGNILHLAI